MYTIQLRTTVLLKYTGLSKVDVGHEPEPLTTTCYRRILAMVRLILITVQGLVSVADRVAARVIARERRGRIPSNFHIVESMPKSVSMLIHYIHLVHGLVLCLV